MTWKSIIRKSNTLTVFKHGLSVSPMREKQFSRMCREGKNHIEKELENLNINRDIPHQRGNRADGFGSKVNILASATALAFGGYEAYDRMSGGDGLPSEYLEYHKVIQKIFEQGKQICAESKKGDDLR
tara:strand:- start:13258 stop:13641 length:384 start_codon:yes stop_codon:yes gene_type:complete